MKIVAIIEYVGDKQKLKINWKLHRQYLRTILENGQLLGAGPFGDDSGALWILNVETTEEADGIVRGDPLVAENIIVNWKIRPFAYWMAKESQGK